MPVRRPDVRLRSSLPILALLVIGPLALACAPAAPQPRTAPERAAADAGDGQAPDAWSEGRSASEAVEAEPQPEAAEPAEAGAVAEASPDGTAAGDEAPDREWLTDDEGRRYYLEPLPKRLPHERLEDGRLRSPFGVVVEVDREDEENFYFRVYEVDPERRSYSFRPDPEKLAQARASYEIEVSTVDRIRLVPFDRGLPRSGQWRNGFALADMNGDGHLDIVHGPPRKTLGRPAVFLGDGAGGWQRWEAQFPPFPYDYGDVAVSDLDGDGRLDLVLGVHLRGLVALVQREPGSFSLWSEGLPFDRDKATGEVFSSRAVAVLDWNGDGRPDIAALGEGPILNRSGEGPKPSESPARGVVVYLNGGDGTWERSQLVPAEQGLFGDSLVATDVDGDGVLDLLASSNVMGRSELLFLGGEKRGDAAQELPVRPLTYVRELAAGDLDGDGDTDLVAAIASFEAREWFTGIDAFLRGADGTWERRLVWAEPGRRGVYTLAVGDLDGDGNRDIVAVTGDGEVLSFLGTGGGAFARQETDATKPAPGCRGYRVTLADLDGDGADEVVAAFAGETEGFVGVLENPGCPRQGSLRSWRAVARDPSPVGSGG